MSTISTEQAKDLRNAFECWQQDYDPVEDKEQYEMFGLGVVAMDELLALRKERERAEPVSSHINLPYADPDFDKPAKAETDPTAQQFESLACKAVSGWIPCSERLPPIAQMVLVHHENEYDFGMVINGHFKIFIMDEWSFFDGVKTAHWKPLPEPPCK
ncbi:DUF551 domain-containing protein [Cronobacter dublinensis]|uniref:DUF551 domain-containing protein n=1 Tax=Cronobacter dublinensis TaxID=413497 RepID=UPI000CFB7849|nr:DUF551 domain-containing protein [Cronobacter dublinensis]